MNHPDDTITASAQAILKSITIPAQPKAVMELMKLCANPNVDINQIAKAVQKDPSLSAKVLKIANSPLFGLRRPAESIVQALGFMGLQTFQRAVLASALREVSVQDNSANSVIFWTHSELVSRGCEIVAKKMRPELVQQAFLVGLFHDCAIPILRKKFGDYDSIFNDVLNYQSGVIEIEDGRYSTNHCVMGYLFARSWQLPESVRLAILRHHDDEPNYPDSDEVRALCAILKISEFIVKGYDTSRNIKSKSADEWVEKYANIVDILGLTAEDILDFEEALLDAINK